MVCFMETPIKLDDLGGKKKPIFGNAHIVVPFFTYQDPNPGE